MTDNASNATAAMSASSAANSAAVAVNNANNAATSASHALNYEQSAAAAVTAAQEAVVGAQIAATNASNAASSTAATAGTVNAALTQVQTTQSALQAQLATFGAVWLGQHATDPSLDNNGNAVVSGAMYQNISTTPAKIRIFESGAWEDWNADGEQASGNAQIAATQAAGSAAAAGVSTTAAQSAATSATASATAASSSATNAANSAAAAVISAANAASAAASAATTAANNAVATALAAQLNQNLLTWAYTSAFQLVSATRDVNEAIATAAVVWPDGGTGVFTTDVASSAFPGAIDAWHATYVNGAVHKTITQPTITRDTNGAVSAQPAITIA